MPDAVARARAIVGRRFCIHGRGPGFDCVGVVAHAHDLAAPSGYPIGTADAAIVEAALAAAGFSRSKRPNPGDALLLRVGPAQLHLGVWTGTTLIHADAGLRRVVETPGDPRWPVLSIWRGGD